MLKQKPHPTCQPSMLSKKQKKRQSSTSQNKENISVTHNNSVIIQSNHLCDKSHLNNKNIQNSSLIKNKSKKNKITENRQRSISRMSNETFSHQLGQHSKVKIVKDKDNQGLNKKIKKTKNDLSIIDLQAKRNQLHTKSLMQHAYEPEIKAQKQKCKKVRPLSRNEIGKSSTIISSSTGNIQFSDRSKEEEKQKALQFYQKDHPNVNRIPLQQKKKQIITSTKTFQSKKYKLNSTRAAIMIQKTWRGYLTRKLLEEYIESFQPLYQEQLKEIRSGRQSRRQIKSSHNRNEKSSFFESSEIEEFSQIQPFEEEKRATQKLNAKENDKRCDENSCIIQQNSQVIPKDSKRSETSFRGESTNRRDNCDMPVQYFRKGKKQTKQHMSSNVEQASPSTFHKNKISQNLSVSKISEFTIKNNVKAEGPSLRQNSVNQSTIKLSNQRRQLTLSSNNTCLTILPANFKSISGYLQGLQLYCTSLQRLFSSFNVECVGDLKTEIKLNNLALSELKERKQALKDIVENGKDFVKNVQDEIGKALKQMKRIVKQGCQNQNEGDQSHIQTERSNNKKDQPHNKKRAVITGVTGNQKSPYQDMDSQNSDQVVGSSSKKSHSAKRRHRTFRDCPSQFQKIQLPTEEYSVKGGSPIQEDFEEEASYDEDQSVDRGKDYQQEDQQNEHGLERRVNQQSVEILNQFLINLIEEFSEITETRNVAELEYLCETLKRVSCQSQNKTIIDRCLIEFIVEIMSETWTLNQIYEGFKYIVMKNIKGKHDPTHQDEMETSDNWKLYQMIRRWLVDLQKWEMNIIQEVPSKMESSSFMHTQNISVHDLREAVNSLSNGQSDSDNSQ